MCDNWLQIFQMADIPQARYGQLLGLEDSPWHPSEMEHIVLVSDLSFLERQITLTKLSGVEEEYDSSHATYDEITLKEDHIFITSIEMPLVFQCIQLNSVEGLSRWAGECDSRWTIQPGFSLTTFDYAAMMGRIDCLAYLVRHKKGCFFLDPLQHFVNSAFPFGESVSDLQSFLAACPLDWSSLNTATKLLFCMACWLGNIPAAHRLLAGDRGKEINLNLALPLAVYHDHQEMVRLLLDAGASVSVPDTAGFTPIDHAAKRGHVEMEELLLKHSKYVQ